MQGTDIPVQEHHPFTLAHVHLRALHLRPARVTLYRKMHYYQSRSGKKTLRTEYAVLTMYPF